MNRNVAVGPFDGHHDHGISDAVFPYTVWASSDNLASAVVTGDETGRGAGWVERRVGENEDIAIVERDGADAD